MSEQQSGGGIEVFFPPEAMIEKAVVRKLTGREWAYVSGLVERRMNPDGQDQTEAYWSAIEEQCCRVFLEIDGVRITDRQQVIDAMNEWDSATIQIVTVLLRRLGVQTDLDTFDFFAPPKSPDQSSE